VELVLSCIWLAAVTWLTARAFHQRSLLQTLDPAAPPAHHQAPRAAVIVPARNEAANIARCLRSLVDQSYPRTRLRILVVDDHSADATLEIAAAVAAKHPQLTVLRSPPLPPHWVGKSHACWIGAQAVGDGAEWLCFIDADVWGGADLVAGAVAAAASERLDLLSLAQRQELQSFAQRALSARFLSGSSRRAGA